MTVRNLEAALAGVIRGSIAMQMARARGLPIDDSDTLIRMAEIVERQGISAEVVASRSLDFIDAAIAQDNNAELVVPGFADALWQILGDPKQNGSDPPKLYHYAAVVIYLGVISMFNPDLQKELLRD